MPKNNQETYLVTGGNGFIGSHMCKALYENNKKVIFIDNFATSAEKNLHKYGEFIEADISNKTEMEKILKQFNPVGIYHFAARTLVGESEEKPFFYYNENYVKTLNLLESCIENNIQNFIFSSTCSTFGNDYNEPIDENKKQMPINTYAITKLLMEKTMEDLANKKLINVLVFRYFNAAGCSPDGSIGENHEPETHLIPNICKAYLKIDKFDLKVFGNDYPTPDGTCVRDYIHVDDLCRTHFDGMKFLRNNSGFHHFNLGTENGNSVLDVIKSFEEVTGEKIPFEIIKRRAGDPAKLVANSTKAKEQLNYKIHYSLHDCIKHSLNYYKKKFNH